MRTIILTLICHYSGMNGKVLFLIPFLLDQEVILLRQSLLIRLVIQISTLKAALLEC